MIFWDLVERHLDEAEFLWGVWEHSLLAPDYTLDEVAEESEERLLAHVDGLVANGPEVVERLLKPVLDKGESHRLSAAALALLQSPGEEGLEAVVKALRTRPGQRGALTRALACADRAAPLERMRGLLSDRDSRVVAAAAEVLLFHQAPLGEVLPVLWRSEEPTTRALALKALPDEPECSRFLGLLREGLGQQESLVLAAAMEAGCRLGLGEAWARVRESAAGTDPQAMLLLALGGGSSEQRELLAALADPERRSGALWALGFVGTPEAVEASLELLQDPQVSHLAGEVFTAVTGIDLVEAGLRAAPREDEALEHGVEDDLPRPDPTKVRQWWVEHRGAFLPEQRYLMGKPRSLEALLAALARGPMRRRPALLLDLQLRASTRPGPRLATRAPTRRQYAELKLLRALVGTNLDVVRCLV